MSQFTGRVLRGLSAMFPAQGGERNAPGRLSTADVQPTVDTSRIGAYGYSPSISSQNDGGFFTCAVIVTGIGVSTTGSVSFGMYGGSAFPPTAPAGADLWIYDVWAQINQGSSTEIDDVELLMASPAGSQAIVVQPGTGVPRFPLFGGSGAVVVEAIPSLAEVVAAHKLLRPMHVPRLEGVAAPLVMQALARGSATWVSASVVFGLLVRVVPNGNTAPL